MQKLKTADWLFVTILVVFLITSFATLSDFGMTWDEAAQHHIGKVGLDLLFGKTTAPEYLRADLVYYGPAFEIVNQYFGSSFLQSFSIGYVDAYHIMIVLAAAAGLLFLYLLIKRLFNPASANLAVILLALMPRFFAHAHYNSKDIPLMAGFVITLFFLTTGFLDGKWKKIALAGAVFGLTLAIRMDAVLILPVFFAAYLVYRLKKRPRPLLEDIKFTAIFSAAAAAAAFALWPTLWREPSVLFASFQYFTHHGWEGLVFYMGQTYRAAELPWHYSPMFLLITTPLPILLLAALGFAISLRSLKKRENVFAHALLLLWFLIRIILTLLPGAIRYDGIRHLLIIFPVIAVWAALGLQFLKRKLPRLWMKVATAGAVLIWLIIELASVHPYGDSYFNEITRVSAGPHLEKKFETEYWGTSVREGTAWLNENALESATVCLPIADHLLQFYPLRADLLWQCTESPDYLMFFPRWPYLPQDLDERYRYKTKTPAHTISRQGSDLLYIYKLRE